MICAHLKYRVIPHGIFGLSMVEDLILAWELVVGCILARHYPPAPVLLAFMTRTTVNQSGMHALDRMAYLCTSGTCEQTLPNLALQCDAQGI